jgi:hypothetical protein
MLFYLRFQPCPTDGSVGRDEAQPAHAAATLAMKLGGVTVDTLAHARETGPP